MEDDELASIRARRLAELQGQSGAPKSQQVNIHIYVFGT